MLLSCLPVSLYAELGDGRRSLADWFRFAGALGLDGADVSAAHLTRRSPADLAALRRQAEDAGVRIAMLATYSDFVHPSGAERRRRAEDLARWIDAGSALGVSAVRVTAGEDRSDVGEADALGWIAGGLTASAAHGRAAGLRVLYENHVRGATWARHDFTQRASRFIDVVRRTKESGLEILFDTANNLALGEDPLTVLEEVIDRVGAVHVSDIRRVGAFEPTVIGTGVSPIPAILRRLVRAGFDGWVSVEEASHTGEEGFRRGVAFADAAWTAAGGRARDTAHGAEGA